MPPQTCTPGCGHLRTSHDRNGCTDGESKNGKWIPCPCKKKYMDLSPGRR